MRLLLPPPACLPACLPASTCLPACLPACPFSRSSTKRAAARCPPSLPSAVQLAEDGDDSDSDAVLAGAMSPGAISQQSGEGAETDSDSEELRCVLAVIRHGDRSDTCLSWCGTGGCWWWLGQRTAAAAADWLLLLLLVVVVVFLSDAGT